MVRLTQPGAAPAKPSAEPCGCKTACGVHLTMYQRAVLLNAAWEAANASTLTTLSGPITKLVAISEAESSGYAKACNLNSNGTIDRGFMQINNTGSESYDPPTCATQAIKLYNERGFEPWKSTYGGPRYLAALAGAKVATTRLSISGAAFGSASGQATASAQKTHDCVYGWTTPSIGGVGGEFVCFDVIVGGLKMFVGGLGAGIVALFLARDLTREVGAGSALAAAGTTRRQTVKVVRSPARVASTEYRRHQRAKARKATYQQRQTRYESSEARKSYQARTRRVAAENKGKPNTVYVTDSDPMADEYKKRARQQAGKRAADRAEAQRRHGDADAPPF